MNLQELGFPVSWETPPPNILRTIETAKRLCEQENLDSPEKRVPLLVNSNYYIAYNALKHLLDSGRGGDLTFCEWGSGVGVVTCIASQLGFDATGIEIEESLCNISRALASEVRESELADKEAGRKAQFVQSSYRESSNSCGQEALKLPFPVGQQKCSVIYAYPWPAEETFIESLFKQVNAPSSLLVTFHGGTKLRVRMTGVE